MPLTTFLHDSQPTQLRGLAFLALSEQGWSLRGTFASDAGGGGSAVWVSGGTVPCRIDPLGFSGKDESIVGGRLSDRSTHRITAPAGTVVDAAERFEIADRGVFEVTVVHDRTDELTKVFEVVSAS